MRMSCAGPAETPLGRGKMAAGAELRRAAVSWWLWPGADVAWACAACFWLDRRRSPHAVGDPHPRHEGHCAHYYPRPRPSVRITGGKG